MTQEGWFSSIALAFVGLFTVGPTFDTKYRRWGLIAGAILGAPLFVRLWILAIFG